MRLLNWVHGVGGRSRHEGTKPRRHVGAEEWRSGFQRSCACRACGRLGARHLFALYGARDGRLGMGNRQRGTRGVAAGARVWRVMVNLHSDQTNRAPIVRCAKGGLPGQACCTELLRPRDGYQGGTLAYFASCKWDSLFVITYNKRDF